MSILLVSLGTSPAVVPEAYMLPDAQFSEVHVLTTASIPQSAIEFINGWFTRHAPNVALTITRVAHFNDFQSEQDHFRFEEVLYRWWLANCRDRKPWVCLSGGFKTMSAAMQKASAVMGAEQVFHVLADSVFSDPRQPDRKFPPTTAEQILEATKNGQLHWIKLGSEDGWPQLQSLTADDYPLVIENQEGSICSASAPNDAFRQHLHAIIQRSHNIAGAWDHLSNLPFPILATWSQNRIEWLQQPLDPSNPTDREWILSLPKIELHCHLGGFATHGELLTHVRSHACQLSTDELTKQPPPDLPPDWPLPQQPVDLPHYMSLGNANGSKLLKDPGCLNAQCRLLYQHLLEQNVVYAEIRCSPNNYTSSGRSAWLVLQDIRETFQACMDEHQNRCHVNLLIIATRRNSGDRSDISRHLALAITAAQHWNSGCRVVGVDLAGFEHKETRAALFATDFEPVHRVGLAVTVHAGENDDAEGIWQAVFKLNARRLGHALHLIHAPDLCRAVADRYIGVEMCPYANLQIKGYRRHPQHPDKEQLQYPLTHYLELGIPVTVNTDNIGISAASLSDNLLLAAELCPGLTRFQILKLIANAADIAFLTPAEKADLRHRIERCLHH